MNIQSSNLPVSQITTRSGSSGVAKMANVTPSNANIMKALKKLQAFQSDIIASNK